MKKIKQTSLQELIIINKKLKATRKAGKKVEIIFDTETTGLSQYKDRMIEFGAVVLVNGKKVTDIHFFTNPWNEEDQAIGVEEPGYEAYKVHGLSKELISTGKSIKDGIEIEGEILPFHYYAKEIFELIDNNTSVGHNVTFDIRVLNTEFEKVNVPFALYNQNLIIDTQPLYKYKVPTEDRMLLKEKYEQYVLKQKQNNEKVVFKTFEKFVNSNTLDAFLLYSELKFNKKYVFDRDKHGALIDSEILAAAYLDNWDLYGIEIEEKYKKELNFQKKMELFEKEYNKKKEQEQQFLSDEEKIGESVEKNINTNILFKTDRITAESTIKEKDFFEKSKKEGIKSVTIMDDNLSLGHPPSYKYAKENGIQLNYGTVLTIKDKDKTYKVKVFVDTDRGYESLKHLNTLAYMNSESAPYVDINTMKEPFEKNRRVDFEEFKILTNTKDMEEIEILKRNFPNNLYYEINETNLRDNKKVNTFGLKEVFTYTALYVDKKDKISHELAKRSNNDSEEGEYYKSNNLQDNELYLNKTKIIQIEKELESKGYINELNLSETDFVPNFNRTIFPKLPMENHEEVMNKLYEDSRNGIEERIKNLEIEPEKAQKMRDRLEYELNIITKMEDKQKGKEYPMAYAEYYLFVSDYVKELKRNGVLVGPGRGSGPGSIIAYSLSITNIDVIDNDLVFERFINEERVSEPDFDVDFTGLINISKIPNENLKNYVIEQNKKKGENNIYIGGKDLATYYMEMKYPDATVAKIANEGRYKAKGALKQCIKDQGSEYAEYIMNKYPVLKASVFKHYLKKNQNSKNKKEIMGYIELAEYLSAQLSDNPTIETIEQNLKLRRYKGKMINEDNENYYDGKPISPIILDLYENNEDIRMLLQKSELLEGKFRNFGIHAAGLVVDSNNTEAMIRIGGEVVYQRTMKYTELVKFDFLGLKSLQVIEDAKQAVYKYLNIDIDFDKINGKDKKTYEMIASGDNDGIPQISGAGMSELCEKIGVKSMEELIAVIALYRPGPMDVEGMLDAYIRRSRKEEEPVYNLGEDKLYKIENVLKPILEPTLGVPVYQEQVMAIMRKVAGFSMGDADLVRRAMGKKDLNEMAKVKEDFKKRAVTYVKSEYGIDITEEEAILVFEKIEGFAGYGFNKSHSASYAAVTFETAYLKANYPGFFYLGNLRNASDIEKIGIRINNARSNNVEILRPDINDLIEDFEPLDENTIKMSLLKVKGFSKTNFKQLMKVVAEGKITSLEDLINRFPKNKQQKTSFSLSLFDKLNITGALDSIPIKEGEKINDNVFEERKNKIIYANNILSGKKINVPEKATEEYFYKLEKETLGEGIVAKSVINIPEVKKFIKESSKSTIKNSLTKKSGSKIPKLMVMLVELNQRTSGGSDMAFPTFMDVEGNMIDIPMFSDTFKKYKEEMQDNVIINLNVTVKERDGEPQLQMNEAKIVDISHLKLNISKNKNIDRKEQKPAVSSYDNTKDKIVSKASVDNEYVYKDDIKISAKGVYSIKPHIVKKMVEKGFLTIDIDKNIIKDKNGKKINGVSLFNDYLVLGGFGKEDLKEKLNTKFEAMIDELYAINNTKEVKEKEKSVIDLKNNESVQIKLELVEKPKIIEDKYVILKLTNGNKTINSFIFYDVWKTLSDEIKNKLDKKMVVNIKGIFKRKEEKEQIIIEDLSIHPNEILNSYIKKSSYKNIPSISSMDLYKSSKSNGLYTFIPQKSQFTNVLFISDYMPKSIVDNKDKPNNKATNWFNNLASKLSEEEKKHFRPMLITMFEHGLKELKESGELTINNVENKKNKLKNFILEAKKIGIKIFILPKHTLKGLEISKLFSSNIGLNVFDNGGFVYISTDLDISDAPVKLLELLNKNKEMINTNTNINSNINTIY